MILTVTLNPAVDKTCQVTRLVKGQVNRMTECKNLAGGKGINVTRVLRQYKEEVNATGFLGGYNGMFISDELERIGAKSAFTKIARETRTNINIISEDGYVTEVLEPGPEISEQERINFLDQFYALVNESEIIVISGSMALGLEEEYYAKMIEICHQAGKKVLVDTSGEPLKKAIEAKPYLIKPNKRELEYVAGKKLDSEEELLEAARELKDKGIELVVVTMGSKGLICVTKEQVYRVVPPKVKTLNTVGSGDCAIAALTMGIKNREPFEEVLKKAVALSAANVTTLENGQIPIEKVREIYKEVEVFKIS
ncbi:MAG: 1-phosphofructokinase [Lachnospiraceae bacterium]|nr:1-phosphofructokinase [Lachnospiraceae bacterium]